MTEKVDRDVLNSLFDTDAVELVYQEPDVPETEASMFEVCKPFVEAIDRHDYGFYNRHMAQDGNESPSPVLLMNMLSTVEDRYEKDRFVKNFTTIYYLIQTNALVNVDYHVLSKFPKLMWYRMCQVGNGVHAKKKYHPWVALKLKDDNKLLYGLIHRIHPSYSEDEIQLFLAINDKKEIKETLTMYGVDQNDIKEAFAKART